MRVDLHDVPEDFHRVWSEDWQTRDIHIITGRYLRALESGVQDARACLAAGDYEGVCKALERADRARLDTGDEPRP